MKKLLLLTAAVFFCGSACDRKSDSPSPTQVAPKQEAPKSDPLAATLPAVPATTDPEVAMAAGKLDDTKALLDGQKWIEAENNLKELQAIKAKLRPADQKRLESLQMVLKIAKNSGLTKPKD